MQFVQDNAEDGGLNKAIRILLKNGKFTYKMDSGAVIQVKIAI